jgi:hypothetical protein
VKKPLSWAQLNEFQGKAITITQDANKQTVMHIAKRQYSEDCLVAMLVETPWPIDQTRIMLRRLDQKFGDLLEKHVPDFGGEETKSDPDFFEQNSAEQQSLELSSIPLLPE